MTQDQVKAIFLLANISIKELHKIENGYWPVHPDYAEIRQINPWWLVVTEFGIIKIGWRKRVINIDWSSTELRKIITEDNVTKWEEGIHAYGYSKAIDYLVTFKLEMKSFLYRKEEGHIS